MVNLQSADSILAWMKILLIVSLALVASLLVYKVYLGYKKIAESLGNLGGEFAESISENAAAVGRAVDVTSDTNLIYRGASWAVGDSFGGWLYDITHPLGDAVENKAADDIERNSYVNLSDIAVP